MPCEDVGEDQLEQDSTVEGEPSVAGSLPDSVDVIVSNGVLNLSTRKSRAIAEMTRVLKPGGRVSIADLVLTERLPDEVLKSPAALAG